MKEISVDARIECTDGPCGKSIAIIVERGTRRVTHLAIEDETLPWAPYQRLVPADKMAETAPGLIRLNCGRDDVARMPPFVFTRSVVPASEDYTMFEGGGGLQGWRGEWGTDSIVGETSTEVDEEQVPEGELALHPSTDVVATDGRVGIVEELIVDPDSAQVTHLVLQKGHWWGKKEVQIPLAAIARVEGETVYLNLDKKAIEDLPVIHR